ncbi:MAG: hypothetical protein KAU07_03670 [Candidatus Andersenbacteria bacterium]|nr:hypothetical protein [Candidatus Andersenbacteria bacterium]
MKNQTSPISSFEWEITESQLQQKQIAYFLEKFFFVFIFIIFIFPPLAFFMIVIAIIIFANLKQNTNIKQGKNVILEKYKIDDRGININNAKQGKDGFYSWKDLSYFYTYSKTNPLFGLLLGKIVGNDFFIRDNDNKLIKLKASAVDAKKVKFMLSKKLKFKAVAGAQTSAFSSSFQIKSNGGLASWLLKTPLLNSSNIHNPKNIRLKKREQEKQFHEQTIAQHRNLQKQKEIFKKKILIVSYLIVMFIVTIIYFVYENKDSLSNYNRNIIQEKSVSKNTETQTLPQKNNSSSVHKNNNELWQDKGWPKNEIDIVRCNQDSDCELYFYFDSEPGKPIPAEIDFNRNVNITRDSQGCFWGAVNKKYKYLWWQRYPLLNNCDISIVKEEQITCHKYTKTCTLK